MGSPTWKLSDRDATHMSFIRLQSLQFVLCQSCCHARQTEGQRLAGQTNITDQIDQYAACMDPQCSLKRGIRMSTLYCFNTILHLFLFSSELCKQSKPTCFAFCWSCDHKTRSRPLSLSLSLTHTHMHPHAKKCMYNICKFTNYYV